MPGNRGRRVKSRVGQRVAPLSIRTMTGRDGCHDAEKEGRGVMCARDHVEEQQGLQLCSRF